MFKAYCVVKHWAALRDRWTSSYNNWLNKLLPAFWPWLRFYRFSAIRGSSLWTTLLISQTELGDKTSCLRKLWMLHHWNCSQLSWTGLWATGSGTRWPCLLIFGRFNICGSKKSISWEGSSVVSIPEDSRGNGLNDLLLTRLDLGLFIARVSPALSLAACLFAAVVLSLIFPWVIFSLFFSLNLNVKAKTFKEWGMTVSWDRGIE